MITRLSHLYPLAVMAILLAVAGCSGDDESTPVTPDTTAPQVVSTSPADGETEVAIDTDISVTFDEEMDRFTFRDTTFFVNGGVDGIILYGDKTAILSPNTSLQYNQTYTAVVTTVVTDEAGNHLDSNYIWSFTTDPGVIMPLAVANQWRFAVTTYDTVANDSDITTVDLIIAGDTVIQSETWYETTQGDLLRNGPDGLYKIASNGQPYLFLKYPGQRGDTYTGDPTISETMEIKSLGVFVPPSNPFFSYQYQSRPVDSIAFRNYYYSPNRGPVMIDRVANGKLLQRWSIIRITLN